jgi:carbamoylphosphate synthase large subunit
MTMKAAGSVLISPAGGQAIHGIVQYFKDRGMTVTGIDGNGEAIGRFFTDKFICVPAVGSPSYADTVLGIIADNHIDLFISWLDPEIIFWNGMFHASRIPAGMERIFTFNFRPDIMNLYDKFLFSGLLDSHGFTRPRTFLLSDNENADALRLPVIVKPRVGYGSKDTHMAPSREALACTVGLLRGRGADMSAFLVQECIIGTEYTVDFFAERGAIINMAIRKRTEHRGVSLKGETVIDDAIEECITRFCKDFMADGLNNIQVIRGADGLYIIDYNPRPSGTVMLSVRAGVDLLNNLVERAGGEQCTRYGKPGKLKMVRYLSEIYYE